MKNSPKLLKICTIKKCYFFFMCVCIKWTHLPYLLLNHGKNDVEVIYAERTQYHSSEFKKMRCEKQECSKYQPCRIFIKNTLAVEITMRSVKTQAAIFKNKFGVNQHDKVLR